jgi:DNA invertase Pin-like site-specific DNA recombinase
MSDQAPHERPCRAVAKVASKFCLITCVSDTFETNFKLMTTATAAPTSTQLGYARVSTGHQSLDQQRDALATAGVEANRIYEDKLSGMSTREVRPGLAALLDYARPGDAIVVVGIDRLGRNAAEVMTTIRELGERDIVLRSLREGIDTSNATGRMVAGVLASLAELELELGRERRAAAREARRARGQSIGRPKALDKTKAALAQRMHASGESASTIAATLGVSRATVYRVLSDPATSLPSDMRRGRGWAGPTVV